MVNPGSFRGARREFLIAEKPAYAAAVEGGYVSDALAMIQRRYFKRFPIDLPHEEDPTPEFLAAVDDDAPDAEVVAPSESLGAEEYEAALKAIADRGALIVYRKAQIKRWLAYQYMKDHDIDPKESGAQNPYTVLLHKLAGTSSTKPRFKNQVNVWAKSHAREIDREVRQRMLGLDGVVARRQQVGVRGQVARDLFKALPAVEQQTWIAQANQEHAETVKKWQAEMEGEPSTEPADRQRCIQGLVKFAQPILDTIAAATGFKVTLIAGGPEPADGGRLNIISVHSGSTGGDVRVTFGRAERKRYKQQIVPIFGHFLKSCFTPEECRRRALPAEEGFDSVQAQNLEDEGATFDAVDTTPAPAISSAPTELEPRLNAGNPPVPAPAIAGAAPPRTPSPRPSRQVSRSVSRSISRALRTPMPVSDPVVPSSAHSHSRSLNPSPIHHSRPASPNPSPIHSRPPSPISSQENTNPTSSNPLANPDVPAPSPVRRTRKSGRKGVSKGHEGASVAHRKRGENVTKSTMIPPNSKRKRRGSVALPPPPAKRARVSKAKTSQSDPSISSSLSPASLAIPPNAPPWFHNATTMLANDVLGPRWLELVHTWYLIEVRAGYTARGKISAAGRPQAVSDWIRRARSSTWRPVINDIKVYEKKHKIWWASLKPEAELRTSGSNGIVGVLASLFYWGSAARQAGKSLKHWEESVEDCLKVVSTLLPLS